MNEIFVTSDLHFGHDKDFLYGPRGFSSSEEHDEIILKNWNETVGIDDTVYVLGDVMMGMDRTAAMIKLSKLNGRLILVRGNHDTDSKLKDYLLCPNINAIASMEDVYTKVIKANKWSFYLSHHPTILGDFSCIKPGHKEFCLHGHTHSKDKFEFLQFCCYNVALDAHGNRPVSVKEIQEDLRAKMQELNNERMRLANQH